MSEMVEMVARAICRTRFYEGGTDKVDRLVDEVWTQNVPQARAAIAAMREPTKDMATAGAFASGEDSASVATGAWYGMIDEALK